MSKERLSKLQKWILIQTYQEEKNNQLMSRGRLVLLYGKEKGKHTAVAYIFYKGEKNFNVKASLGVTITKSLRNLVQKGYIFAWGNLIEFQGKEILRPLVYPKDNEIPYEKYDIEAHKIKYIGLTEKGRKKAKILLKLRKKLNLKAKISPK